MKVFIFPILIILMVLIGFTADSFGVGNAVFTDDSCLDNPPCSAVVDPGDGFFGAIVGIVKTFLNFFAIFIQVMTLQLDINLYANLFIAGFLSILSFTVVYVLLRQG